MLMLQRPIFKQSTHENASAVPNAALAVKATRIALHRKGVLKANSKSSVQLRTGLFKVIKWQMQQEMT